MISACSFLGRLGAFEAENSSDNSAKVFSSFSLPSFFSSDENLNKLVSLIRTYFKFDGHHIQFNVVNAETLKDAQKHPEKYQDLIVRVAGYSDYFNDLGVALQNEIIRRTEHEAV